MNGGQIFVLCIIAISMLGGTLSMWVKGPGMAYRDRDTAKPASGAACGAARGEMVAGDVLDDSRKVELLTSENERLTGKVSRLEEAARGCSRKRIATDPAERVAREIDALR